MTCDIGLVRGLGSMGENQAVVRILNRAASAATAGETAPDFAQRLDSTGDGRPIPSGARESLESGLGVPLGDVRPHTGTDRWRAGRSA